MSERVIVNASPMIALLGIGQEGLLHRLFGEVLLPEAVRDEIEAGLSKDANVGRLAKLSGIEFEAPSKVDQRIINSPFDTPRLNWHISPCAALPAPLGY